MKKFLLTFNISTAHLIAATALMMICGALVSVSGQSTEQQFPTPLRIPELEGTILPRALGDARNTTHFYTFEGSAGDLFLNIVTTNLNADIDLFIEEGLRPLTKIVVYADRGETETGRVIYLRKPEKLLLRVQGRTLNDDPARYRLKFAGTFVAAAADIMEAPELPKVMIAEVPIQKVTSSGENVAEERRVDEVTRPVESSVVVTEKPETIEPGVTEKAEQPPRVVVTDSIPKSTDRSERKSRRSEAENTAKDVEAKGPKAEAEAKRDPMADFELVVTFRDGSKLTRPMIEVQRFQVDKGVLMILNKNGSVSRYSMADVENVSIQ